MRTITLEVEDGVAERFDGLAPGDLDSPLVSETLARLADRLWWEASDRRLAAWQAERGVTEEERERMLREIADAS